MTRFFLYWKHRRTNHKATLQRPSMNRLYKLATSLVTCLTKQLKKCERYCTFRSFRKLVKIAAGIFNTHHRMGDARNEVIAAHAAASGADTITVQNILKSNTTDKATELLNKINLTQPTYDRIAQKIYTR